MRILSVLLLTFLFITSNSACQQNRELSGSPTPLPTNPSNPTNPTPSTQTKIEFRVNGSSTTARIRYTNAVDGTTQVVSSLPYITTISTTESSMFLTLEATPISYSFSQFPFMSVQIFVNGVLFREAVSDNLLNTVSVAGTWRR